MLPEANLAVRSLLTVAKVSHVAIDHLIFRLHYIFTVAVLLIFFALITTKQFIGNPIMCQSDIENYPHQEMIDTYCWIEGTFTNPEYFNTTGRPQIDVLFPGIGGEGKGLPYSYYQWVYFVLFLQAMMFYFPRWLWLKLESGRIEAFTHDLEFAMIPKKHFVRTLPLMVKYLLRMWRRNNGYALMYFMCELLNFINVVGQMFFMDRFFNGRFLNFGNEVIKYMMKKNSEKTNPEYVPPKSFDLTMNNPMLMLFPRMTTCTYKKIGPTGQVQNYDFMCVMVVNIFNEKLYVFLWFWLVLLGVLSGLVFLCDIIFIFVPKARLRWFIWRYRYINPRDLQKLSENADFGDIFVLDLIGMNLNEFLFKDLVTLLSDVMRTIEKKEEP